MLRPAVSLFFWHRGGCGTVRARPPRSLTSSTSFKRNLAQQRRDYYRNATARFASFNNATASPGVPPKLAAQFADQLASGMLPSPCNASYVSFACGDSSDGIVHEPPQNWLGALLDENEMEIPPVPEHFLKIHGLKEEKLQMDVESGVVNE